MTASVGRPRWLMSALALLLALGMAAIFRRPLVAWFSGAPMGGSASSAVETTRAGALSIDASLRPDPPRQQGNTLQVSLRDAAGKAVEHAHLEVGYVMPAMGAMPEMRGLATVREEGGGRYAAHFDLPMGGTWTLEVKVGSAQGAAAARYTLTVGSQGLTALGRGEREDDVIVVAEARRQLIGVKTAPVERKPMRLSIRALGRVTYDESRLVDVTLRVKGWIQELRVSETGQAVRRGQPLFTLYSPELYAGQQEYLLALARKSAGVEDSLARASRKRLELWGLSERQIQAIARRGEPSENVPFLAPASGFVIEKNVVEGSAIESGQRLFRIAPLDRVWIEAEVYESDLPRVKKGQPVEVTLPYLPGKRLEGKVDYLYPYLAGATRTGKVRIELPNPGLELKPEMYADVSFQLDAGERLQVPVSAVLYTGPRRLVFVDLGEGRLRPQEVQLGLESEEAYEIVSGLKEGDVVVTSGNFLIAAESRIRSATEYWSGGKR